MFWVWYYCPRQSPNWQACGGPFPLNVAITWAEVAKPPAGRAQVTDANGNVVYSL